MLKNSEKYFKSYVSNSIASGANQMIFSCENTKISRSFFKISVGGTFEYSFLYSSIIDSTFNDGSISKANDVCDDFTISALSVCVCPSNFFQDFTPEKLNTLSGFKKLTFNKCESYSFKKGELVNTDSVKITAESGDYLCFEIAFGGKKVPCHFETLLPIYAYKNGTWVDDVYSPVPNLIGIKRKVEKRICYLGDSITQGIGTYKNSYLHWNSILSDKLGTKYSYWNLGIGYGRANDVAQNGVWLYKALQNDVIIICFGVNDIFNFSNAEKTESDLKKIVEEFISKNKTVILQTVPPFCYNEKTLPVWHKVNNYLKDFAKTKNIALFDEVFLLVGEKDGFAIYGGHPNEQGSKIWAEEFYKFLTSNKILN